MTQHHFPDWYLLRHRGLWVRRHSDPALGFRIDTEQVYEEIIRRYEEPFVRAAESELAAQKAEGAETARLARGQGPGMHRHPYSH